MNYQEFISKKRHLIGDFGFSPEWLHDSLFDFQKDIIERACIKGRHGNFIDTGQGKTRMALTIAHNIVLKTNQPVLILTPLAVAFQFVEEADEIGIESEYSRDGSYSKKIVVTNYERLHYFEPSDFSGVMLDESSILKNFKGQIKSAVTSFMKKVKYRQLFTATPSPNDFIELGTSSEALGYMGYMDMLGRFFKNNQSSIDSNNRNIGEKWYLKPHARKDFFAWVNQWSIMCKMPSDLGYSNDRYQLPELIERTHTIKNRSLIDHNGQSLMFTPIAKSMTEVRHEQKCTESDRCEKAVELARGKISVYWCNTNNESALIKRLDDGAVEIKGSMSIDQKEEILIGFSKGEFDRLITKAKMTSMGLNWQHCNHTVFFPTWSYEQYYQAIRRFWRFGQSDPVHVDLVISDGMTRVVDALSEKSKKAKSLYNELTNSTHKVEFNTKDFNKKILLPKFAS